MEEYNHMKDKLKNSLPREIGFKFPVQQYKYNEIKYLQ